ncbi:MAG: hypothetical protein ACE5D6_07885, partial [Candidatus Zixiibacteriota bacterium]
MRLFLKTLLLLTIILMIPGLIMAQVDNFGKTDTLFAEIAMVDSSNWSITISYTNDENIVALSVPLKMTAGINKIVADSAIYTGGRIEHFAFKGFRPDT